MLWIAHVRPLHTRTAVLAFGWGERGPCPGRRKGGHCPPGHTLIRSTVAWCQGSRDNWKYAWLAQITFHLCLRSVVDASRSRCVENFYVPWGGNCSLCPGCPIGKGRPCRTGNLSLSIFLFPDQPRGLVVRVSDYWSWGPGFDSRFYRGNFSLKGKFPMVTMVWIV
jgi:hypothetical protein